MIVTINAWLYILSAAAMVLTFFANQTIGDYVAAVFGILWSLGIGVGLLKRLNWARWIAIGVSLVSWTIGPLLLIWVLIHIYRVYNRAHHVPLWFVIFFVIAAAVCSVVLWLTYKLYKYLTSNEGRGEFHAPETERHVVVKSTAAYIIYLVIVGFLSPFEELQQFWK